MKKTMKKLLIILLLLFSAVSLFAAEGDVKESDTLTVTTSVGAINYIAFVDASKDLNPAENPTPIGKATPIVEDLKDGYEGIGVAVRTNKPYSLEITLTGDPMSRTGGTEVYPLTVSKGAKEVITATTTPGVQTTADDGTSVTFETADDSDSLSLAENNDNNPTGCRMFYYPLTLTCDLTEASEGTYSSEITVTIQAQSA